MGVAPAVPRKRRGDECGVSDDSDGAATPPPLAPAAKRRKYSDRGGCRGGADPCPKEQHQRVPKSERPSVADENAAALLPPPTEGDGTSTTHEKVQPKTAPATPFPPPRGRGEVDEDSDVCRTIRTDDGSVFSIGPAEMAVIKAEVYKRCQRRRRMHGGVRCPKFMLDPLIARMMRLAKVTERDVFLDLGSGVGNFVASVATMAGCACYGIELDRANNALAEEAQALFSRYRQHHGLRDPPVTFMQGDMRKQLTNELIAKASVVWCANKLMPIAVDVFLLTCLRKFPPGCRIFTMKNLLPHDRPYAARQAEDAKYFTFTDFTWGPGDVEWTDQPGRLYMYTRTDYQEHCTPP